MKKNMVYFVLYIVLIVELLIVITERDELQEAENQIRDKMLVTLADMYSKPIIISIPEKESDYNLKSTNPKKVLFTPIGLFSAQEKESVKFYITVAPGSKKPRNWPDGGVSNDSPTEYFSVANENGNAVFSAKFVNSGKFEFEVKCEVERVLPDYLPHHLLDELKERIGETNLHQISAAESFKINAKRIGGLKKKAAEWSL